MKIYEVEGNGLVGATDIQNKVILINRNLRKYPELRDFVLRHEKQHLKENSYFKAFLLDMKDYPVLYSNPVFWEFQNKYADLKWHYIMRTVIYNFALLITVPLIQFYAVAKIYLRGRKKNG